MLIDMSFISRHFYLILTFISFFCLLTRAQGATILDQSNDNEIIYHTVLGSRTEALPILADENELLFDVESIKIEIGQDKSITLSTTKPITEAVNISFNYQIGKEIENHFADNLINELQNATLLPSSSRSNITLLLHAKSAGHIIIGVNNVSGLVTDDAFIRVTIEHSAILNIITLVIGWLYFVAWSVSFYPQVLLNYSRKSVIGLNFDYLAYNITGFIAYSVFNVGMYWVSCIEKEYFETNPRGVNPVQLNDVIFALHAAFITAVTIFQTFIYERGAQKVSIICKVIFSGMWLFTIITLVLAIVKVMTWFRFVFFLSYVKLLVTLIKYIPQVHMNCKRQSTVGWSIWNVLLDFSGGVLSILQMFLLAYNNDDWDSIFGDPTKFGLGVFSIMFDLIFMLQHFVLYREASYANYTQLPDNDE